jgi:hypothetical protein
MLIFADITYPEQKIMKIKFELLKENQVYKISNIYYPSKNNLVEILRK